MSVLHHGTDRLIAALHLRIAELEAEAHAERRRADKNWLLFIDVAFKLAELEKK